MNVVIGKIGKSLSFDTKSWNGKGGDCDAYNIYYPIIKANPNITFYCIGKNDLTRKKLNIADNLIDIWQFYNTEDYHCDMWRFPYEFFKRMNITIDYGLIYTGPVGRTNIPNHTPLESDSNKMGTPLDMLKNYVGPMFSYLNESKITFDMLCVDKNYFPYASVDLINPPRRCISVWEQEHEIKSIIAKGDNTKKVDKVKEIYSKLDATILYDKNKLDLDSWLSIEKPIKIGLILNQGNASSQDRLKILQEYVLDYDVNQEAHIYGNWKEEVLNAHSQIKGVVKFHELDPLAQKFKYTLVVGNTKGPVTTKFREVVYHGMIPFVHETYDTQNNLDLHDFLRVKNSKELHTKIKALEQNPEKYKQLRVHLYKKYLDDVYFNGQYASSLFKALSKNIEIVSNKSTEQKLNIIKTKSLF